jgi:predicted site-specific integrase-resolvase
MHNDTVSLAEAARLAHVTRGTIQHWLRTGRLAIDHVPPRSEIAKARNKHVTRPFGMRVRRADVLACSFAQRMSQLKDEHQDLNLLTVREFSNACSRHQEWAYRMVRKFKLQKYYVDSVTYLVSGKEFWEKAQEDPYYAQLFLKK